MRQRLVIPLRFIEPGSVFISGLSYVQKAAGIPILSFKKNQKSVYFKVFEAAAQFCC